MEAGGSASVRDLVEILETSDKAIFNLSRELRLLGVTAHEPNMVRLVDEVLDADDREMEMRRRIATALRRHRAHSTFRKLAERSGGIVTLDSYARDLPNAFPAVDVARTSWTSYARAFLFWMEYAGLIIRQGADYISTSEPVAVPTLRLLDAPTPVKARPGVPYIAPRRALDLLKQIRIEGEIDLPAYAKDREAVGALVAMGAVSVSPERTVRLAVSELVHGDGEVSAPTLCSLLAGVPGGQQGLDALTADPRCSPKDVGEAIAAAAHMNWTAETTRNVGGHFRAWAKAAGITIKYPRRGSKPAPDAAHPALWDLE